MTDPLDWPEELRYLWALFHDHRDDERVGHFGNRAKGQLNLSTMLFSLYCADKPDSLQLRMDNRPDHVAFLVERSGQIVYGGPLLADDGETPVGSLLIIEVPDRAAAEAFAAGDPYNRVGLFASVVIRGTRKVFPKT